MEETDVYWSVVLKVFSFNTEEEAKRFHDILLTAFCSMAETESLCTASKVVKERIEE